MAAAPESLMLQHKQPFASSRNSSDCFSGSSGEETLMVFAAYMMLELQQNAKLTRHLPSMSCFALHVQRGARCTRGWNILTAVSPNSFMMTAIR